MLQWGLGSAHEALTEITEVSFGGGGGATKESEGTEHDQLLGMSASNSHTLFRTAFGRVYAFGSNSYGQLGIGDRVARTQPQLVKQLEGKKIMQLACGSNFSMAVDGKLSFFFCILGCLVCRRR